MLGNIDAIIATLSVVLGVSLVVQGLQQIFKQWLDLKSNYMRLQLLAMFDDQLPGAKQILLPGMRRVSALTKNAGGYASEVVAGIEGVLRNYGYKDLELLESTTPEQLKEIAKTVDWKKYPLVNSVGKGLEAVNKDIDCWFGLAKKGFQDLYERRMKLWAFLTSLVVVLALNADVFDVYRQFSSNAPLRDAAISWGDQFVKSSHESVSTTSQNTQAEIAKSIRTGVDSIRQILGSGGFQVLGWDDWLDRLTIAEKGHSLASFWIDSVLGWFAMALLVSLGAPFWYDLLKTVMGMKDRIRSGAAGNGGSPQPGGTQDTEKSGLPALG
jgi:hypothetical protein